MYTKFLYVILILIINNIISYFIVNKFIIEPQKKTFESIIESQKQIILNFEQNIKLHDSIILNTAQDVLSHNYDGKICALLFFVFCCTLTLVSVVNNIHSDISQNTDKILESNNELSELTLDSISNSYENVIKDFTLLQANNIEASNEAIKVIAENSDKLC